MRWVSEHAQCTLLLYDLVDAEQPLPGLGPCSVSSLSQIVGRSRDDTSLEESPVAVCETVYALMDHISPSYRANFSKQLASKLSK